MSITGPTGINGQDGLQGVLGWRGPIGPTGLIGWGGGQTPGPTGGSNFNLSQVSGTSVTVTTASLGTTYYITNTAFDSITMPNMTGLTVGGFWVFQNSSGMGFSVTISGGTITWSGGSGSGGPITVPAGTGFTLVHSSGTSSPSFIVF